MEQNSKETYTPLSGRIGNFLIKEEIIEHEDSDTLSRFHISDIEGGWEVIIPQTYGAYNIIRLACTEDANNEQMQNAFALFFDNMYLVTTCPDGGFQSIISNIAALGFTPAVNKKAIKERKQARKFIDERLRSFEFKTVTPEISPEEERQDEIAQEARDILDRE